MENALKRLWIFQNRENVFQDLYVKLFYSFIFHIIEKHSTYEEITYDSLHTPNTMSDIH